MEQKWGYTKKADPLGLHWNAIDFTLPMTLSLYDYYYGVFHPVFNWFPDNPQWWITGFNPNETYHEAEKQYMVGSVCFIDHDDMYKTLRCFCGQLLVNKAASDYIF